MVIYKITNEKVFACFYGFKLYIFVDFSMRDDLIKYCPLWFDDRLLSDQITQLSTRAELNLYHNSF
jgi:hypothetical protein